MAFLMKVPRQQLLLALRRAGVALDDEASHVAWEAPRHQGEGFGMGSMALVELPFLMIYTIQIHDFHAGKYTIYTWIFWGMRKQPY